MGGKNAIIVDSSANIKKAAQGVASSAFTFQGQKCSACSRAIVLSDVYDEFAEAVIKEAKKLKADQGCGREDHVMGPVIDKAAVVLQHPFGGFNMSGTDAKTGTADYLINFLNLKSVTEDLTD